MPRRTQAETFIQTLTELRDAERDRQKARVRRQLKSYVKRFILDFRIGYGEARRSSGWLPPDRPTASGSEGNVRAN